MRKKKNWKTRGETLGVRTRTNSKIKPTKNSSDTGSWNRTRAGAVGGERSHQYAIPVHRQKALFYLLEVVIECIKVYSLDKLGSVLPREIYIHVSVKEISEIILCIHSLFFFFYYFFYFRCSFVCLILFCLFVNSFILAFFVQPTFAWLSVAL